MNTARLAFLNLWHKVKHIAEDIMRDGDNQYAYIAGQLVSAEPHYNYTFVDGVLTTEDWHGEDEDAWDTYVDGRPTEWTEYRDSLVILFYRKNYYSSRFDFYNNEVERGFDDWLESWQTEYWVADENGKMTQLTDVTDWVVSS